MSSESSSPYGDLSRFNFTGGFPTGKDLAPSIIFLIIYVAAIPFLGWRLFSAIHRDWILIRPAIFLSCRLGMLGLRAWMSKNTYGEGELIAELVLVSIGYLFLMDPIIGLWRRHVAAAVSKEEAPRWVNLLSTGLKLALLGAIGTAVAGSAQISGAISDPSKVDGVVTLRKTSAFLALAVSVLACLAIVLTHFEFRLDARRIFFLIPCTVALMIISIFRVLQIYSKNPNAGIRKPVAFWIMQMLMELIVFIALLSISIPLWFPKPKKIEGQDGKDVEMGQAERISSHSK